jgi:HK97 family phage major capsid protein
MSDKISEARAAVEVALDEFEAAVTAVGEADADDLEAAEGRARDLEAEVERRQNIVKRLEDIAEARAAQPVMVPADEPQEQEVREVSVKVTREESVYHPDRPYSFFRDLYHAHKGERDAQDRLGRHKVETEGRDLSSSSDTGGADFVPPVYLEALYVPVNRQARKVVNTIPTLPLPDAGMTISMPKLDSGVSVAAAADNGSVSETDATTSTVTANVRLFAGQQDISVALFERTNMDAIVLADLVSAYDAALESAVVNGTSGANSHVGLLQVSGTNGVTYTDASPTAAETIGPVFDAVSQIEQETAGRYTATHLAMTPRRAAWLAGSVSSSSSLFQVGTYPQSLGEQGGGTLLTFAGLPVVTTTGIPTNLGAGTNQDRIIAYSADTMRLMEGPLRTRVLTEVLSGNLTVRIQAYAFSAFASERMPKAISVVSGTGLTTPAFA